MKKKKESNGDDMYKYSVFVLYLYKYYDDTHN